MLMDLLMVLLSIMFTLLGVAFIFVSATDLNERWARNLFGTGTILLLVVAIVFSA